MASPRHGGPRVSALLAALTIAALLATLAPAAASAERGPRVVPEVQRLLQSTDGERRATRVSAPLPELPRRCRGRDGEISKPGPCYLTRFRARRPTLMVWGDSHAWQQVPALRRAVRGREVNLVSFLAGRCPPIALPPGAGNELPACETNNQAALAWLRDARQRGRVVRVVLAAFWQSYRELHREQNVETVDDPELEAYLLRQAELQHRHTPRLFRTLRAMRIGVDVVAQTAFVPLSAPTPCPGSGQSYLCAIPRRDAIPEESRTRRYLKRQMKGLARRPRYIDVNPAICDASFCYGRRFGIVTFSDLIHLSRDRSRRLGRYYQPSVGRVKDTARGR